MTRVGRPIPASVLRKRSDGDRRIMMDAVGLAIAELLPVEYQGAYAENVPHLGVARRVLHDIF